ncbi:hypothetical protein RB195_002122 [Necator americanus]|uniref:Uncharacterized protein n=1 Tax=Necator americanus TaxID=51031 RepID=A0ABR1DI01_NECAM
MMYASEGSHPIPLHAALSAAGFTSAPTFTLTIFRDDLRFMNYAFSNASDMEKPFVTQGRACSSTACLQRRRVRGREHQLPKSTRLSGRRSQRDGVSSVVDGEAENEHDGPYSSDGDEEMMEVVVEDDVKNESVARSSTDVEDRYKDMFQKMEMMYASARESMLKVMREPTEGTQMESEQALQQMDELTRRLGLLAENVGRNGDTARLARRHDVPSVGCPQALTPIRKLHKRTHLRKAEQAKRKPVLDIPDCAQDEREACAVCIRMQPISGSTKHRICWIQCPTCEDWMYTDCISNNVCPRDGAELRRNDV